MSLIWWISPWNVTILSWKFCHSYSGEVSTYSPNFSSFELSWTKIDSWGRALKKVIKSLLFNDQKIKRKNICKFGWKQIFEKKTRRKFSFQMRNSLTLMVSIILKMIEGRYEIVMMTIKKVALSRDEKFSHQVMMLVVCLFQEHNDFDHSRSRNSRSYCLG